ncbi:MAG TPA: MGMT family protein [Ornithinibacter sp.]|nr:MGMT family protein [Ornithinibacter sp.]
MLPTPYAESILDLVARVPSGRVVTYGDVAGLAGGSALSVGNVMSRFGSGVPWWRVIRAGGLLPPGHEVEAARRLSEEGVPFRVPAERVDLERCRWRPDDE